MMKESPSKASSFHYAWLILLMAFMTVFASLGLARFGYSVLLPAMQENLGLDQTETGLLVSANLGGYLFFSAVGGALATRYGPRIVISFGLALCGLGMWMTGMVSDPGWATFWCGVTGIGSGASNLPVMGLLSLWFASRKRGMSAGIAVSGSSLGLVLVGMLVPELLEMFEKEGWRTCWLVFGVLCLLLSLAALLLLRDHPDEKSLKPCGSLPAEIPTAVPGNTSRISWNLIYRSPKVWHLGVIYVAFGFSYIIYLTFFVVYLIREQDYLHDEASLLFMLIGWVSLFCGVIWGSVSDRIGRSRSLFLVYLLQSVAYALFWLSETPSGFFMSALIFGFTAWSIPAIMAAACGDVLEPRMASAALGFITLFFGIGQSLGPLLAGWMADYFLSYGPGFLAAATVSLAGAIGSLFLKIQTSP
jgi:sugar phosphate permease